MEPIAAQQSPLSIRPVGAPQSVELASLLREGRVLAGEVLQSLADGSVLVGVGRHRVPAQTHLRLDPGHRFLFQVEAHGKDLVLRVLGSGAGSGMDFLGYLRAVLGEDRPLGELLHELAARVRAGLERPADAGAGASDALRRLLAALEDGARRPEGGADLRARLLRSGLSYEAALLRLAARGFDGELAPELGRDLKAELLRALADLPEGPLREAVARALAGLEAEQLLNLARAHSGEPQVFSLPVVDGDGWTTLRVLVPPRRERGDEGAADAREGEEPPQRVVLGIELSRLGPLRADVAWSPSAVSVRVLAERPEVVELLRAGLAPLAEVLGRGERAARVAVAAAPPEDVRVGLGIADVAWLRDHHVMDVSG